MAASISATLEGLPKTFVSAMKTLFEIMDDRKTGYVKLTDLENFWSEEGLSGLPKGVIESLRKVTPPNGLLSFERFCAGLKICLLRYQSDQQKIEGKVPLRSPSAPILDLENGPTPPPVVSCPPPPPIHPRSPTATVRPNNAMLHSRAISMPQLVNQQQVIDEEPPPVPVHMRKPETSSAIKERRAGIHSVYGNVPIFRNTQPPQVPMMGPPKPPRIAQASAPQNNVITNGALMMRTRSEITARPSAASKLLAAENKNQLPVASLTERAIAKAEVRTALQQWQLAQMDSEKNGGGNRNTGNNSNGVSKRREPRRHTLQSGIDQSMLRRIQVMEQERQVLTSGLQAVERAQEWFNSQLSSVQERIRSLGKSAVNATDYSIEAQQERLGFKIARIEEVSRQLIMLIDNADRGFPVHMNLALADRNKLGNKPAGNDDNSEEEVNRILRRLKSQNHQLTEEVGRKSERITMLEKEKSSLIRELFQARSQPANRTAGNPHVPDDNTLIVAMKTRTRRNKRTSSQEPQENQEDVSTCSTPGKEKENITPTKTGKTVSTHKKHCEALLKDFDHNVAMNKKEIHIQSQLVAEKLTMPFFNVLIKIPTDVKNMEWANKRLPKPGEVLVSLKGSPVMGNPSSSVRGISNTTAASNPDTLEALLNNPDALSIALKDKKHRKAFIAAYNKNAEERKE
nr:EOG090X08VB [Eurycercus lamellatus]